MPSASAKPHRESEQVEDKCKRACSGNDLRSMLGRMRCGARTSMKISNTFFKRALSI